MGSSTAGLVLTFNRTTAEARSVIPPIIMARAILHPFFRILVESINTPKPTKAAMNTVATIQKIPMTKEYILDTA